MASAVLGGAGFLTLAEFGIPPMPPWEGLHPVVVHLPLGTLAIAPLFVLLAMVSRRWARPMSLAAFVLILLGTLGIFLALTTGEATERFAKGIPGAEQLVHQHEEAAEMARNVFIGASVLAFAVFALATKLVKTDEKTGVTRRGGWMVANLILLGVTGLGALALANTGHLGGQLVHGLGVRAPLITYPAGADPSQAGSLPSTAAPRTGDDDD